MLIVAEVPLLVTYEYSTRCAECSLSSSVLYSIEHTIGHRVAPEISRSDRARWLLLDYEVWNRNALASYKTILSATLVR